MNSSERRKLIKQLLPAAPEHDLAGYIRAQTLDFMTDVAEDELQKAISAVLAAADNFVQGVEEGAVVEVQLKLVDAVRAWRKVKAEL